MRVLALDYGSAHCGCALSDPTGTISTPIDAIDSPDSRRGLAALVALVAEREVEHVVVGLPVSLRGKDTEQTSETREFAAKLSARLGDAIPVELYDERFTTRIAARDSGGAKANEHSRAAAVLLDSWLSSSR